MATSSRLFDQQWAFSQRGISCHLVPGFTLLMARFVHDNTISKEVCRVFVLRCLSASHLTCHVSSHRVHLSRIVYAFIQVTFIHPYINTFTYSYIHAYTTSFIHGCISHQGLIWSHPFSSVITHHCFKQHVLQTNIL